MFDFPIQDVQMVQEYAINDIQQDLSMEISEVDLSFYNALASQCSGEASSGSSGPINRPTTKILKPS